MNSLKVAAALRALADAFEEGGQDAQAPAEAPPAAAQPQKRGRGRPVKGEEAPAPAAPAAPEAADPFSAAPPPAPTVTAEQVGDALRALSKATSQQKALEVLKKAGEASNLIDLKPEKYAVVIAAVNVELRIAEESKPAAEPADPFATGTPAPAAKPLTLEEVKAEIVKTQKRTSDQTIQTILKKHGGKAASPDGNGEVPSLKALPEAAFAAFVAEIQALPTTK